MKQQVYENMLKLIINEWERAGHGDMPCLITRARILLDGGDSSASVIKELANQSVPFFAPRDPENMDPYGPQNHMV